MSWVMATSKIYSEDRKAVNLQNIIATISLKYINPTANSMLWISLQLSIFTQIYNLKSLSHLILKNKLKIWSPLTG